MDPLISLRVRDALRVFLPGDELACEYQIDAVDPREIQAVEASVLWYTEGKGDEDMAVHFFQRRVTADAEDGDLRPLHTLCTQLPNSPLSYSGIILKVRWCVRLRVFLRRGRECSMEVPFQLGSIAAATIVDDPQSILPGVEDTAASDGEPHAESF